MTDTQGSSDVEAGIAEIGLTFFGWALLVCSVSSFFALDFWGALVGECRYEYSGCDTLTDYRNEGTVALFMFMGFVSILSSAFIFLGFAEGLKHLRYLRNK